MWLPNGACLFGNSRPEQTLSGGDSDSQLILGNGRWGGWDHRRKRTAHDSSKLASSSSNSSGDSIPVSTVRALP